MSEVGILGAAARHAESLAVIDDFGEYGYEWLDRRSRLRAAQLLGESDDLNEARVAFLMEPGFEYVVTLWAIWRAGGVAVPLSPHHPVPELEYVVDDSGASILMAGDGLDQRLRPIATERELAFRAIASGGYEVRPILPVVSEEEVEGAAEADDLTAKLPDIDPSRRALILYTSGTTGRPKGVVTTHATMDAQMRAVIEAWGWESSDRILHVLPLHHTHGIMVALGCALYSGATVEFARFDPATVWNRLSAGEVTVFMAVPTIYVKLVRQWEEADEFTRARWSKGAADLRLMTSGSAALPVSVFDRWERITGSPLLERYGMTEVGMALTNPYGGDRRAGTVGQPLPGAEVRLMTGDGQVLADGTTPPDTDGSGEIEVRGQSVFSEYWGRAEETAASFTDGWFRTGDEAVIEGGYYRILGRQSVDILKSGGYKISAVEIEELLRAHPGVNDCAVVGIPDEEWGERIAAAVVTEPGAWFVPDLTPPGVEGVVERTRAAEAVLDPWLRERLAGYKIPRQWRCVGELPRNAMGKVQKQAVRKLFGTPLTPDALVDPDPGLGGRDGE